MTTCTLTKLEAARRQIDLAIRLFFADGDPVPLHTLVAAAYDVLRDLNKKACGKPTLTKDSFIEIVSEGDRDLANKLREVINAPQNYLKHADRDPDAILVFDSELTIHLLFDACNVYRQITGNLPRPFRIFDAWFKMQYHNLYRHLPQEHAQLVALHSKYKGRPRQEFFDQMLEVCDILNLET